MIIKVKPKYKPLVQMRGCCFPCSFLWILFRRGFWVDQEEIARELKTRVFKKDLKLFSKKMLLTRKMGDLGVPDIIGKNAYLAHKFLRKHRIPLKMTNLKIGRVKDPKGFIIKNLKKRNDIMLSFNWKGLGRKNNWGHIVVISELDTEKDIVVLGDPGYDRPKFWRVKLNRLVKAMSPKYDGVERGFHIFSKKKV